MSSFPIIFNQSNAQNSNTFIYDLPTSVDFSNIEIALADLSMYYSWYSITASQNNNKYSLMFPNAAGYDTYNITIPDGTYTVNDLNNHLQWFFIKQGLFITNNTTGENTYHATFTENTTGYAVSLTCYPLPTSTPSGYTNKSIVWPLTPKTPQFIINNIGFGKIIGFSNGQYPSSDQSTIQTFNSDFIPQISPVQSVIVLVDAAYNPYSNNSGVIHTFTSKGTAFGSLISSNPNELNWVTCQQGTRSQITLRFVDQVFQPLNILDTNLTVKLLLREKKIRKGVVLDYLDVFFLE